MYSASASTAADADTNFLVDFRTVARRHLSSSHAYHPCNIDLSVYSNGILRAGTKAPYSVCDYEKCPTQNRDFLKTHEYF